MACSGQRAVLFVYITGAIYAVALSFVVIGAGVDWARTPHLANKYKAL